MNLYRRETNILGALYRRETNILGTGSSDLRKDTDGGLYAKIQLYSLGIPSITSFSIDNHNQSIIYSNDSQGISFFNLAQGQIEDMALHLRDNSMTQCHEKRITGLELHSDGGLFTTSSVDEKIKVWDRDEMQCVYEFHMQEAVYAHSLSETLIAAGSQSKVVRLADLTSGSMTHTLFGHKKGITSVQWMPGREKILASASMDGTIRVWDVRMAHAEVYILHHQALSLNNYSGDGVGGKNWGYPNGLVFSKDGSTMYASGNDDRISVWNVFDGCHLSSAQYPHTNKACRTIKMAINEHDLLFHPSDDGSVYIYDMDIKGRGRLVTKLHGHLSPTFSLELDNNDRLFSASTKDGLYKWDYAEQSNTPAPLESQVAIGIDHDNLMANIDEWD